MMEKDNKIVPTDLPETKEVYEAPVIEMVEAKVEYGFQTTDDPTSPGGGSPKIPHL